MCASVTLKIWTLSETNFILKLEPRLHGHSIECILTPVTRSPFLHFWPCDLELWLFNLIFIDERGIVSIPVPSLVISVSAVLVLSCWQTDRQTHTDTAHRLTHAIIVDVSNKKLSRRIETARRSIKLTNIASRIKSQNVWLQFILLQDTRKTREWSWVFLLSRKASTTVLGYKPVNPRIRLCMAVRFAAQPLNISVVRVYASACTEWEWDWRFLWRSKNTLRNYQRKMYNVGDCFWKLECKNWKWYTRDSSCLLYTSPSPRD